MQNAGGYRLKEREDYKMQDVRLAELVGGALQEKFAKSFERVLENMLDSNTPFKTRRSITIKLSFDQNEQRDDVKVHIDVAEKLAPQGGIETSFAMGRNLKTGEIMVEEYGKQIKGQLSFNDVQPLADTGDGRQVDTETGEIVDNVVDLRRHG